MTEPDQAIAETGQSEKSSFAKYILVRSVFFVLDLVAFIPLLACAIVSRFAPRKIDIGIGPVPIINGRYHKRALERYGYTCETYVDSIWHITDDFDVLALARVSGPMRALVPYLLFLFCIFRYRCLYIYFVGGPLRHTTLLCLVEPVFLRIAGIRTVVTAYGMDVNVLTRTGNLLFVHGMSRDYDWFRFYRRRTERLIDTWTRQGDFIIAGCDWVDYLYYWDLLMLAHFAVDTEEWSPSPAGDSPTGESPVRLLHAPNHRNLKGTAHIVKAVEELRAEGLSIELDILEGVPNDRVKEAIKRADVIVDQLVIGWYAMFALEGMASAKPVICYLRPDLKRLFVGAGIIESDELPLIEADVISIKDSLRDLFERRSEFGAIGQRGREFVLKHHSLQAIGAYFDRINRTIGVVPRPASR